MRSHGVPQFPDPTNNGTSLRIGPGTGVNASSTQFRSAQASCGYLLPDGDGGGALGPTLTPAEQLDYLKAAACVRAHGIANFPDPVIKNGHVKFVLLSSCRRALWTPTRRSSNRRSRSAGNSSPPGSPTATELVPARSTTGKPALASPERPSPDEVRRG